MNLSQLKFLSILVEANRNLYLYVRNFGVVYA